jgi:hypothetical protein
MVAALFRKVSLLIVCRVAATLARDIIDVPGKFRNMDDTRPAVILHDDEWTKATQSWHPENDNNMFGMNAGAKENINKDGAKSKRIPVAGNTQKWFKDEHERYMGTQWSWKDRDQGSWYGRDGKDSTLDRPISLNFPGMRSDKTTLTASGKHVYTRDNIGKSPKSPPAAGQYFTMVTAAEREGVKRYQGR